MPLTDRAIRALKPTAKHQFLADGNGLYLRVHPSGTKQFVYRSRVGGKARWVNLGVYPALDLLEARRKTLTMVGAPIPDTVTVEDLAKTYKRDVLEPQFRRPDIPWARITANVLPVLGKNKVASLAKRDIFRVIQPILDRDANVMANRVLSDIKHLTAFAVQRGLLATDPAADITKRAVGGREQSRDRVLSEEELTALVGTIEHHPRLDIMTKLAMALVLVTGQRASEILTMDTATISGRWWAIPQTKAGRPHRVYLTPLSRYLVRCATMLSPVTKGTQPFTSDHRVLSHALRRLGVTYTPHDFRRTMATHLSDAQIPPHVIERMLNHQMAGVMAVYNRSEFTADTAAAWTLWSRMLLQKRGRANPA